MVRLKPGSFTDRDIYLQRKYQILLVIYNVTLIFIS